VFAGGLNGGGIVPGQLGVIGVGLSDTQVLTLMAPDGTVLWGMPDLYGGMGAFTAGPVLVDVSSIFLADPSGHPLWSVSPPPPMGGFLRGDGRFVLLTASGSDLLDIAGILSSGPIYPSALSSGTAWCRSDDGTLVYTDKDDYLHAVDSMTGTELWSKPGHYATTVRSGGLPMFALNYDGHPTAMTFGGEILWSRPESSVTNILAVGPDGTIYVAAGTIPDGKGNYVNYVGALSPVDGSILWWNEADQLDTGLLDGEGTLFVAGSLLNKGTVAAFDSTGAALWFADPRPADLQAVELDPDNADALILGPDRTLYFSETFYTDDPGTGKPSVPHRYVFGIGP
jgi:outer membrane protein assembly factor BamB